MTLKILHLSLTERGENYASLRYFWNNPTDYKEHQLPLAEIKDLGNRADRDYYTGIPVDYATTGKALYNWLDKSDRVLANALNQPHQEGLIIAIATDKGLAHLPWELLHDGKCFLIEKRPAIIPVRWVSNDKPIENANSPQNRPLNVLFMATSPLGVEPVLDYEAEEGQILAATQRTPVDLRVEESGCLNELSYVVREYEKGYFDVFHLTGHATHQDEKPCFLTEDEYGNRVDSNTTEIYDALKSPLPPLIFLSGCRTGYTSDDTVPAMAEELLNLGATAVLGWGERVRDTDATAAARQLYWHLSQGETVIESLSSTYPTLIKQQARDWHKLRLYVANTLPEALVTPLNIRGRKRLPKPTTTNYYGCEKTFKKFEQQLEFFEQVKTNLPALYTARRHPYLSGLGWYVGMDGRYAKERGSQLSRWGTFGFLYLLFSRIKTEPIRYRLF
jgi:CHAT domain-containing protein